VTPLDYQLLDELGVSDQDRRLVEGVIALFEPEHGARGGLLLDLVDVVGQSVEDDEPLQATVERLAEVEPKLDDVAPFTFVPMKVMAHVMFRGATLLEPDAPIGDSVPHLMNRVQARLLDNPTYLVLRQSVGDRLDEFLELTVGNRSFYNFGRQSLTRRGPSHYLLDARETYAKWGELTVPSYIRALFADFEVEGEVTLTPRTAHRFVAEMAWDPR